MNKGNDWSRHQLGGTTSASIHESQKKITWTKLFISYLRDIVALHQSSFRCDFLPGTPSPGPISEDSVKLRCDGLEVAMMTSASAFSSRFYEIKMWFGSASGDRVLSRRLTWGERGQICSAYSTPETFEGTILLLRIATEGGGKSTLLCCLLSTLMKTSLF